MKTPTAPIRPSRPCSAGILTCESTFAPPNSQKTYNHFPASWDPISDRIVPRFFELYREHEIFCNSKTANFNFTRFHPALPSRPLGLAMPKPPYACTDRRRANPLAIDRLLIDPDRPQAIDHQAQSTSDRFLNSHLSRCKPLTLVLPWLLAFGNLVMLPSHSQRRYVATSPRRLACEC